jgi:hypothetical protein
MAALAPLTRELSALYSNQRDEPTCAYHVFSKLLLKNRIEIFYQLPIDLKVYNTNKCNRYLDTQDIKLETLTPEECTPNGFLKIILFHYFYSLYDIYLNLHGKDKKTFSLDDIDVIHQELNYIFIPESISHKKEISNTLGIVNRIKQTLDLRYHKIIVHNKVGILDIIRKILSLQFYIGLVLQDDMSHEEHAHHAVHIIAIDEDEIIFKNSWGDERVYNMKVDDLKFKLGPYTFEMEYFLFYLPVKVKDTPIETVNSLETMDVFRRWVDEYVRQFPEMMSRVPELLATMPEPAEAPEPPPITRSKTPTFEIGDVVVVKGESIPLTITEKRNKHHFYVTYKDENGDDRNTDVFDYNLTKLGGTKRHKRKSRKRIR